MDERLQYLISALVVLGLMGASYLVGRISVKVPECPDCNCPSCPEIPKCPDLKCPDVNCPTCPKLECPKSICKSNWEAIVEARKAEVARKVETVENPVCKPVVCPTKYDYCRVRIIWGDGAGSEWRTLNPGESLYKKYVTGCEVLGINFGSK